METHEKLSRHFANIARRDGGQHFKKLVKACEMRSIKRRKKNNKRNGEEKHWHGRRTKTPVFRLNTYENAVWHWRTSSQELVPWQMDRRAYCPQLRHRFFFKDEDDKRLRDNIVMEETDRRSCSYLRIADMLGPSPGTEANHRCVIIVVHVPMHTRMQRGISSFS